ncbi:MFS transporter [Izhakiella australiensis]|uniref:MFS transporter n=1 Tax=Izhakiella australiensis TaxID=1926881 RepID=UPI001590B186|nr:MFS transporter [Izhakiella australiensis]
MNSHSSAISEPASAAATDNQFRKVVTSAAIGQFVEWYDFVIYAYSATVIANVFFPGADPVAGLLAAFAAYAVGFLMRPVGGVVFGILGDRIGRRSVLALIILLMGAATVGVGLLPGYNDIGLMAPILLVVCRLVQGLSAAGESTGSNSFVAEHSPDGKRARYVAFTYSFSNVAPIFAAACVLCTINLLAPDEYESWGWRIPFLISGPLAFIGLYIRRMVDESPVYQATVSAKKVSSQPLRDAFRQHKTAMMFCFALSALSSLGFYTLSGYFASYLQNTVGLSANKALISNGISLLVAFIMMNIGGILADRYGRKPILITSIVLCTLLTIPAYMIAAQGTFWSAVAGQCLLAAVSGLFWGPLPITLLELFPTRTRFSASSVSLNLAYALFGGTAPYLGTWLVASSGSKIAPAVYMTVVTVLVLLVTLKIPETFRSSLLHKEDS